jgi:plasmid stabilization system protein ParE
VSRRVTVAPEARADLFRLNAILADQSDDAARRAMDTIDTGLRSLGQKPHRAPERLDGRRELMIPFGRSGYVVQFRVQEDSVVIARVYHMREDRSGSDE